jgi:hypothetical protein
VWITEMDVMNFKTDIAVDMIISTRHVTHRVHSLVPSLTLKQKKFTDAVNGKSGLTYADAVASEVDSRLTFELRILADM